MLSKVMLKYVINVSKNLQGRDVDFKEVGNSPLQTSAESCCFPLISFVNVETDWLKTFDKRRIDG